MHSIKFVLFTSLNFFLGLIFIYSAYSKLYPIEPFEMTFIQLHLANWATAPFIARFLISIEFFIGLMLISNIFSRFMTLFAIVILTVFSLYLLGIILTYGNNGNCGCFGEQIIMTPFQALLKNIFLIGCLIFIYKYHSGFQWSKSKYLIISIAIISLVLPHILNYVELSYSKHYLVDKKDSFPLNLDTLIKNAKIHPVPESLKQGKHIIAFMSLTCPHCRIAAKKMHLMKLQNPNLPFYLVLNGEEKDTTNFFEDTKARNIPFTMLFGKPFVYLAGLSLPSIYLVKNDTVEKRINYVILNKNELEKWLRKNK
mgnify:CR=1 FL=1